MYPDVHSSHSPMFSMLSLVCGESRGLNDTSGRAVGLLIHVIGIYMVLHGRN